MNNSTTLMHKNIRVADIRLSEGRPTAFLEVYNADHLPIGVKDLDTLLRWLELRNVPMERKGTLYIYQEMDMGSSAELAGYSNNISFTDCYWFKNQNKVKDNDEVNWSVVSPFRGGEWSKSGQAIFTGKLDYFKDLNSPDFGTSGGKAKTWVTDNGNLVLLKEDKSGGRETFAQIAASEIAELLRIDHIHYFFSITNDKITTASNSIIRDDSSELVSLEQLKLDGMSNKSISAFLRDYGLGADFDSICILDYLTWNNRMDLSNLSVIRDPDTLQIISMSPAYGYSDAFFGSNEPTSIVTGALLHEQIESLVKQTSLPIIEIDKLYKKLSRIGEELELNDSNIEDVITAALKRAERYNMLWH